MIESKAREAVLAGQGFTLTGNLALTAPLTYPAEITTRSKKIVINLNGFTLSDGTAAGLPYLIGRIAPDQTTALNKMQDVGFTIRDGRISGKTGTLVRIDATYGTLIEGITFSGGDTAVHLQFALMGAVKNCVILNPKQYGIILDRGRWSGASNVNSQSNHSRIEQCRVFNADNAIAAFAVRAASGCVLHQLISEGRVPQYHILFDSELATVVKDFTATHLHFESTKGNGTRVSPDAGIYIRSSGGYVRLGSIFSQYDMTLINAEGSNYPHLYVEDTTWLTSGTKFQTGTAHVVWDFNETPNIDLTDPNRWVGSVPYYFYQRRKGQGEIIIKKP